MIREYFAIELSASTYVGLPVRDMAIAVQCEQKDICVIPGVNDFWYGVINFQGSLMWILDSDRFFSLPVTKTRSHKKLTAVILDCPREEGRLRVALAVQNLKGIVSVEPSQLQSLTDSAPSSLQNLCSSMVREEERVIYLLNSEAFLQELRQQASLAVATR